MGVSKRLSWFVVILFAILASACSAPMPPRTIYLIGIDRYIGFDGIPLYVFGYAVDGAYYAPAFKCYQSVDRYKEYLRTIGLVVNSLDTYRTNDL